MSQKTLKAMVSNYKNSDKFLRVFFAEDAFNRWYNNRDEVGEVSNPSYIRNFCLNNDNYIHIYQCDIDGDGQDERLILEFYADEDIMVNVAIEKMNEELQYIKVFDFKEKYNKYFSCVENHPCVIVIDGVYYLAENNSDNINIFLYDSKDQVLGEITNFSENSNYSNNVKKQNPDKAIYLAKTAS